MPHFQDASSERICMAEPVQGIVHGKHLLSGHVVGQILIGRKNGPKERG
jgi:hypothetical protein